jgi:hypothetical protein
MKKLLTFFTITLICPIAAHCQHPFKQNLGEIATITFPDTPKTKKISTEIFYISKYDKATYFGQAAPLPTSLRDLLTNTNLDSVYNSFANAVLIDTKGRIFYKKNITVNALNGVEFGFAFKIKEKTYYDYQNVFYLNDVLINYSYLSSDSLKKDDEKIKSFFGTFKLTIKPDQIRQTNSSAIAYHAGALTGKLLFYGLVIAVITLLGFGIVLILKRITNK